jgi:hypothetical protein
MKDKDSELPVMHLVHSPYPVPPSQEVKPSRYESSGSMFFHKCLLESLHAGHRSKHPIVYRWKLQG